MAGSPRAQRAGAALEQEWGSGQLEGQINRVKMIKRVVYGRAKFELLRRRILCVA